MSKLEKSYSDGYHLFVNVSVTCTKQIIPLYAGFLYLTKISSTLDIRESNLLKLFNLAETITVGTRNIAGKIGLGIIASESTLFGSKVMISESFDRFFAEKFSPLSGKIIQNLQEISQTT